MKLLIRADGSARIGTGHVMRCLSLAQGWRHAGGEVLFAMAETTPALELRLESEGFAGRQLNVPTGSADDATATIRLAHQHGAAWVVADGYHFDAAYQAALKKAGLRLLILDDYGHASHYHADLVLNQNLSAREEWYKNREPYTRLLLGTRHVLLGEAFRPYRDWQRQIPATAGKILVTLGGGDPDNATGKVIEALRCLDLEARIVVGGSNPHLENLRTETKRLKNGQLIVDTKEMPELMAWADLAIAAGGTTSWELAFMGLPSMVLVLAENQAAVAAALDHEGVGVNLGEHSAVTAKTIATTLQSLLTDAPRREVMSQHGRRLVNGNGVSQVVTRLQAANIRLRRAVREDSRCLWEWANHPTVRASAFSSEPIPWTSHQSWFATKLASPTTAIFIGLNAEEKPFGQIRFDWNDQGDAEIDVTVDGSQRKSGLGSALIRAGADEALALAGIRVLHADVKKENLASVRAFEKAGFRHAGIISKSGQEAWHLILTRDDE